MAKHLFKSSYGQCRCRWCGAWRHAGGECPVSDDMRTALKTFAASNGRTWKHKLWQMWTSGGDGGLLRQCRNLIGPARLQGITRRMLEHCVPSTPRNAAKGAQP